MHLSSLRFLAALLSCSHLANDWNREQACASPEAASQESTVQVAVATPVNAPSRSGSSSPSARMLDWAEIIEADVDPAVVTNAGFREAIKATRMPWRVRDKATSIEMLLIPPGEFVMGKSRGDDEARTNELPSHEVRLTKAFYLGRYEVTQQQYANVTKSYPSHFPHPAKPIVPTLEQLMADGATKVQAERELSAAEQRLKSWIANQHPPALDAKGTEWPVEMITWDDCAAFCKKAGFRLPTEAEWEYACRAGTRTPRFGELDRIAWYTGNSDRKTRAVGTKQANALGIHDMLGNVCEWVNDWYGDFSSDAQTNPQGPSSGTSRVFRSTSWNASASYCRVSLRNYTSPNFTSYGVGFRVARTP